MELQIVERPAANPAQPAAAYLASLRTDVSRRGMASALNTIAEIITGQRDWRIVDWSTLNAPNARAIMSKVMGAPATRNKVLSALRGVAHMAEELKLIDADTMRAIERIKGDTGTREAAGRNVAPGEIVALMQACANDPTATGARDAAMIAIAKGTGCRRAEIAGMRYEGMTTGEDGKVIVKIVGKRNKERKLYVKNGALQALQDWLAIRGADPGPMFYAINKGGRVLAGHGLTTTALDSILIKRSKEAGVKDLDWHDLRRTVVGELLDAGADIVTVAGIVGHSNVATTQRYDRRGDRARDKAAELISVPYFGRKTVKSG
jgi:site-specific recombinase XerC